MCGSSPGRKKARDLDGHVGPLIGTCLVTAFDQDLTTLVAVNASVLLFTA